MLEVLAPVGNIQSLKAAIYAGADAVYLGLDMFNARIKAGNFNKDNIKYYIDYCHLFGVKVYIAFNTSVKQSELDLFAQYVDIAAKGGADAFIVTDLGTLDIFRKYDIPLHGSTQIGVHNLAGAKILEELGFTRVVLARETLIEDIIKIKNNTSLEIEHFVHGALCVCFSGACLMSSMMSGDSGNRGRCNQPCRLKYTSQYNNKPKYLLSPKDQCLIDKIEELRSVGVYSLKIEGRLKHPQYVGNVVKEYRKAVDRILYGKINKVDHSALKRAYNRGNFTAGYNYEQTDTMMYCDINGNIGEKIGEIVSCTKNTVKMKLNFPIFDGDGVKIIKDNVELGGFAIKNLRNENGLYVVECNEKFAAGASVHLTSQKSEIDKYERIDPKMSIKWHMDAVAGEELKLKAICGDAIAEISGGTAEYAVNSIVTRKSVSDQLLRLGDSEFTSSFDNISVRTEAERPCFIPKSKLNSMRRDCVNQLKKLMLERYDNTRQKVVFGELSKKDFSKRNVSNNAIPFVEINGEEREFDQLYRVHSKYNLVIRYGNKLTELLDIVLKNNVIKNNIEHIYLKLPRVARGADYDIIEQNLEKCKEKFFGIIADNLYAVYLAKRFQKTSIGGIGLNIYNSFYDKILELDGFINSVELNKREVSREGAVYAFGYLPIMTLLHCPVQLNTGCKCNNCKYSGKFSYYDKRGAYEIRRIKMKYCQFELYNQQIVDTRNKISAIKNSLYLDFSMYECDNMAAIIEEFSNKIGAGVDNATYGHLFRGVK